MEPVENTRSYQNPAPRRAAPSASSRLFRMCCCLRFQQFWALTADEDPFLYENRADCTIKRQELREAFQLEKQRSVCSHTLLLTGNQWAGPSVSAL